MSERPFSLLLQVLRRTGRSLSNDDGDINENGKKSIGLEWQNNNFARESLFFVNFFAIVARLRRETSWFHVLWRTWTFVTSDTAL